MSAAPEDTPVLILKTTSYPMHSGTIGIARSLGRLGVPVHVVGETASVPVARSRYVRWVRPLPAPDLPAEELVGWLADSALPGRPVLIPMDDVGAVLVSEWSDRLRPFYRFPEPPAGLAATVCDKVGLARLAAEAGVPTPVWHAPESPEQLEDFIAGTDFPVVVKARDPGLLRQTSGASSVAITRDAAALRDVWRQHLVEGRSNCMLQEYVPGGPETVWMVNAYVDESSSMHLAASARKIRQRPAYTGATTLGVCERNDDVLALTAQLVKAIRYRGVLDIGWRYDARDGCYKVLDLNPRVGATFRLFAASNGADVVRALYADLTGRPLPSGEILDGRRWVSEFQDLSVARRYIGDGMATRLEYLRSWRGVAESVWWAPDDPAPAVAALRAGLAAVGRRQPQSSPVPPPPAEGPAGLLSGPARPAEQLRAPGATAADYFDERSGFWDELYEAEDVEARIYQRRHAAAAAWLRRCGSDQAPVALELGCGAGRLTAELAEFSRVVAVDSSTLMLGRARRRVPPGAATFLCADAARLPLGDSSVDVVAALGVLPWVPDVQRVVAEAARVLRPGGSLVVSVDNRWRIGTILDPLRTPFTAPLRRALRRRLAPGRTSTTPRVSMHSAAQLHRALQAAGLEVLDHRWIGFGPVTVLGRAVLPRRLAGLIDRKLQARADSRNPVRLLASQYLVRCVCS